MQGYIQDKLLLIIFRSAYTEKSKILLAEYACASLHFIYPRIF